MPTGPLMLTPNDPVYSDVAEQPPFFLADHSSRAVKDANGGSAISCPNSVPKPYLQRNPFAGLYPRPGAV